MSLPRISPLLGLAFLSLGAAPLEASAEPLTLRAGPNVQDTRGRRTKASTISRADQSRRQADPKRQGRNQKAKATKGKSNEGVSALPPLDNPLDDARPLSSAEKLAMFDANANKRLDPVESLAAHKEVKRRKAAMDQILRDFDSDKNGLIGPAETKAVMAHAATQRRRQTEAKYDTNRDGRLAPAERAAMLRDLDRARAALARGEAALPGSPQARAQEAAAKRATALQEAALFLRFDEDKNGKHSPQEAQALAQFQQAQRIADSKAARKAKNRKRSGVEVLDPNDLAPLPPPADPSDPRQQLLARFDLDGDGQFNEREQKAITQYYARRKGYKPGDPLPAAKKESPRKQAKPKKAPAKKNKRPKELPDKSGA